MPKQKTTKKRSSTKIRTSQPEKKRRSYSLVFTASFIGVLLIAAVVINKREVLQSVKGASIVRNMFAQATITLPQSTGTTAFNIYYRAASDPTFIHAVRNIPGNNTSYTINYLKKGTVYQYKVAELDSNGKEVWFSPIHTMTNISSM